jgi:DNA-directed RNA polymerase subunit RPC12/RpoP
MRKKRVLKTSEKICRKCGRLFIYFSVNDNLVCSRCKFKLQNNRTFQHKHLEGAIKKYPDLLK